MLCAALSGEVNKYAKPVVPGWDDATAVKGRVSQVRAWCLGVAERRGRAWEGKGYGLRSLVGLTAGAPEGVGGGNMTGQSAGGAGRRPEVGDGVGERERARGIQPAAPTNSRGAGAGAPCELAHRQGVWGGVGLAGL